MRSSRQPLRGFLRMRILRNAINHGPHAEGALGRVSKHAPKPVQWCRCYAANFSHALGSGMITPGEAATIAAVVDTFVRAIETSDFERRLRLVEADHFSHPGAAAGTNGANGYHYNP